MQQGCYGECLVHRNTTIGTIAAKCAIITLIALSTLAFIVLFFSGSTGGSVLALIVLAIAGGLACYMFPRFNIDWEYVFVDGQLDFDQILGGNGRKRKDRIDFDYLEIVAPTDSNRLDQFKNLQTKNYDYSSLSGGKTYTIICRKKEQIVRILFEPDDNMLDLMKQKSYRKVFKD